MQYKQLFTNHQSVRDSQLEQMHHEYQLVQDVEILRYSEKGKSVHTFCVATSIIFGFIIRQVNIFLPRLPLGIGSEVGTVTDVPKVAVFIISFKACISSTCM